MDFIGRLEGLSADFKSGRAIVSFVTPADKIALQNALETLKDEPLDISFKKHSKGRSKDANAMLWACLGDIANHLHTDNWSVYLMMLRRYGQFTYICVKPNAVDAVKKQWRESEEIGKVNINGQESVQLICYYGSHTYNTKEFSRLLEGVISEMKEIGLPTPSSQDMRRSLEEWEKKSEKRASKE